MNNKVISWYIQQEQGINTQMSLKVSRARFPAGPSLKKAV